jgi:DNA-binding NarL/FixJ family response regulator
MNVLINVSEPIVLLGLEGLLKKYFENITIDAQLNENKSFKQKANKSYDLIIIDTHAEFREMKKEISSIKNSYKKANIIVYGGHKYNHQEFLFIEAGASGYISKNSQPEEVINAINLVSSGFLYLSQDALKNYSNEAAMISPIKSLSKRELEVFEQLINGSGVNDISANLGIKQSTTSTLKKRIMEKVKVDSLAGLIKVGSKYGYS